MDRNVENYTFILIVCKVIIQIYRLKYEHRGKNLMLLKQPFEKLYCVLIYSAGYKLRELPRSYRVPGVTRVGMPLNQWQWQQFSC